MPEIGSGTISFVVFLLILAILFICKFSGSDRDSENTQQIRRIIQSQGSTLSSVPEPVSRSSYAPVWIILISVVLAMAGYFAYQFNVFLSSQVSDERSEAKGHSSKTAKKIQIGEKVRITFDTERFRVMGGKPGKVLSLEAGKYLYTFSGGDILPDKCVSPIPGEKPGDVFVINGNSMTFPGRELRVSADFPDVFPRLNAWDKRCLGGIIEISFERVG